MPADFLADNRSILTTIDRQGLVLVADPSFCSSLSAVFRELCHFECVRPLSNHNATIYFVPHSCYLRKYMLCGFDASNWQRTGGNTKLGRHVQLPRT